MISPFHGLGPPYEPASNIVCFHRRELTESGVAVQSASMRLPPGKAICETSVPIIRQRRRRSGWVNLD